MRVPNDLRLIYKVANFKVFSNFFGDVQKMNNMFLNKSRV